MHCLKNPEVSPSSFKYWWPLTSSLPQATSAPVSSLSPSVMTRQTTRTIRHISILSEEVSSQLLIAVKSNWNVCAQFTCPLSRFSHSLVFLSFCCVWLSWYFMCSMTTAKRRIPLQLKRTLSSPLPLSCYSLSRPRPEQMVFSIWGSTHNNLKWAAPDGFPNRISVQYPTYGGMNASLNFRVANVALRLARLWLIWKVTN